MAERDVLERIDEALKTAVHKPHHDALSAAKVEIERLRVGEVRCPLCNIKFATGNVGAAAAQVREDDLRTKLAQAEAEIERLSKDIGGRALAKECDSLRTLLAQADAEIERLRTIVNIEVDNNTTRQLEVADLCTSFAQAEAEIEQLRQEISDREAIADNVRTQIAQAERHVDDMARIIDDAAAENSRLRAALESIAKVDYFSQPNGEPLIQIARHALDPADTPSEPGCKRCGRPLAYDGAVFCGAACSARWEDGDRAPGEGGEGTDEQT